jgi:AraC family transcriptional regulator
MLYQLNHIVAYIENHLTEDLSAETLARNIRGSVYHFNKVFFYLSGYSMSEYIKNRRLSEANKDLLSGKSVTDVAFIYRYQSVDGFTRAFKRWGGIVPSEVKKTGFSKTVPKLTFTIQVKGGTSMECRIRQMPAFNLVGVSKRVPMQFEGVNQEIVKLAQSITEEQRAQMHALQDMVPFEVVNASYDADANFLREEGELTHLIGILTTKDEVSSHLEKIRVEPMTWAVFPCEGPFPSTLQDTMARVYSEWLPSSGYEVVDAPTFSFTKMDAEREGYAYSEVWTPIRKIVNP